MIPRTLIVLALTILAATGLRAQERVVLKAADGIEVYGSYYAATKPEAPIILAFHQASSSRGEYNEIAPWLVEHGFAVLAIDQRSGDSYAGQDNETAKAASGTFWVHADALSDLQAAIAWAGEKHPTRKILLWGSSYSASLAIVVAAKGGVAGVLAFSPADNFDGKPSVRQAAKEVTAPIFITSSQKEAAATRQIFDAIAAVDKTQFVPQGAGVHGSRVLFPRNASTAEYWTAVEAFLDKFD